MKEKYNKNNFLTPAKTEYKIFLVLVAIANELAELNEAIKQLKRK